MSSPILFITACLIWGSTFFAITLELGDVPPAVSVVYRFGLAAAALFTWCKLRGDRLRLPWKTQRWMMVQGCATFGLSYICTYTAEQYLVSGLVAVLFALMVFWNPIGNRIVFGTPLTWRTWSAAAVATAGVALLFLQSIIGAWKELQAGGNGHFLLGLVLAIGASFVLPTRASYWGGLLYLSLFGSVIAFNAYFTLIDRIGSQKAVYIGVVTPVISVLLSIRLEHFRPGPVEWLGMLLCLSSVAWALKSDGPKPVPPLPLKNIATST